MTMATPEHQSLAMPKTGTTLSKRACDSCRQRKVKCDTEQPCANCRISHLDCTFHTIPRKRGPKTPREKALELPATRPRISNSPERSSESDNTQRTSLVASFKPFSSEVPVYSLLNPSASASEIRGNLVSSVAKGLPTFTIRQVVDECISLYVLHTFPVCPICHIPAVRAMAATYFPLHGSQALSDDAYDIGADKDRVAIMRPFALLTALCATVASMYPESLLAYRDVIATPFLQASRSMLKVYEDYDVQHPDWTSLAIRLLQSAALQHSAGKTPLAWHVLSQAGLLAQNLRLHSEQSLSKYDLLEATLLRNNFWMLYVCDKAAISLANRPVTLHEPLFDSKMDLLERGPIRMPLFDPEMRHVPESFEDKLMEGFHLIQRFWTLAGRLLLAIRSRGQKVTLDYPNNDTTERTDRETMMKMYIDVIGFLDGLPNWLESPDAVELEPQYDVAFQRSCFWTQKSRLLNMFHGVRIMVLRQCIEYGLTTLIGLSDDPLTLAMEQTNIARDVVQSLKSIPFQYIQTNGEPDIELMRVVGSILLELSQNVENDVIRGRARSFLSSLLDILARLDSKASEDFLNQQG
ncbi:C6 transcription factor [Colletotrichum truncatum]|uniref:C6 transcription factor n=1 Tax=Colletotrichum truncatum TaxID=5467 RepID=A0ACC3ZCT4_COLTU|nr:C6 transcription factor [Colletotrichum truncatum]KAF6797887.1 C6 transcription factor [Colletotrichum truncatum]